MRTLSANKNSDTRHESFREAVRERDLRCFVTGETLMFEDDISGFEAVHIFPLAYLSHWRSENFDRWISIPSASGELINSVQNGILLRADIHALFDNYLLSINPDVCRTSFFCTFEKLC